VANAIRLAEKANGGRQRGDGITELLASRMGVTQRWIQILSQLDADLHPDLKAYFRAHPDLTLDLAKACRVVPGDRQLLALDYFDRAQFSGWKLSPEQLKDFLTRGLPSVSNAIFDVTKATGGTTRTLEDEDTPPAPAASPRPLRRAPESATPATTPDGVGGAAGSESLEESDDLDDEEFDELDEYDELQGDAPETRFLDPAEFERLQTEAIEAKRLELLTIYPFIEVRRVPSLSLFHDFPGYVRHDGPEAGAFILVDPQLKVEVIPGWIQQEPGSTPAKEQDDLLSRHHHVSTHGLKTNALQAKVAANPFHAMRVAVPALLGLPAICRISRADISPEDVTIDSSLEPAFALLKEILGKALEPNAIGTPLLSFHEHNDTGRLAKVIGALAEVDDSKIADIFAALIASRVGSFPGYRPEAGDSDAVVACAEWLGATVERPVIDDTFLKGYRRAHLLGVAAACGIEGDLSKKTLKDVRALIAASPGEFYPPELQFLTHREAEKALKNLCKSAKATKAKPGAKAPKKG
jgi:hypothetical protein